MSIYWYAVSDAHREVMFLVDQGREPVKEAALTLVQTNGHTLRWIPLWLARGEFRIVNDSEEDDGCGEYPHVGYRTFQDFDEGNFVP